MPRYLQTKQSYGRIRRLFFVSRNKNSSGSGLIVSFPFKTIKKHNKMPEWYNKNN